MYTSSFVYKILYKQATLSQYKKSIKKSCNRNKNKYTTITHEVRDNKTQSATH